MSSIPGRRQPERGQGESAARLLATAVDVEAFYQDLFLPLVRRAIRRHGLSNDDARDIVQEAFAVALVKMEAEGNPIAWLKKVVDFLAINMKRTAVRRAQLLEHWVGTSRSRPPDSSAASQEDF